MLFLAGLILIPSFSTPAEASSSCPYYYDIQPPQSTSCDPFGAFDLAIACRGCSTNSSGFSIAWNGNNSVPGGEITTSDSVTTNENGEQVWCIESRLTLTGFLVFSSNLLNKYYFCQIASASDNESSFSPSTSLFLEPLPSFTRCSSGTVFASNEYRCAIDQPINTSTSTLPNTSTSTLPIVHSST